MKTYKIFRGGKELATIQDKKGNYIAVLDWFHSHTSCSMDWAMKYEGYKVVEID